MITDITNDKAKSSNKESSPLAMEIKPLSPALGVEILKVDLTKELDDAAIEHIRQAWYDNSILLLRGQQLSESDQLRFAERFGVLAKLHDKPNNAGVTDHPSVMLISNMRRDGQLIGALPDGEMYFHSDQCYLEEPCAATMLYAIEIPSHGGNTLYSNTYKAYDTLPTDIKRRIDGRSAMNVYDYSKNSTSRPSGEMGDAPSHAHPIVRIHPVTGRKALFVNRLMTIYILDMPRDESDEILKYLFDSQAQPQFVYEHVWAPGDLMLWDNRCTLHARTDFNPEDRRLLRRIVILGEKPF